MSIHADQDFVLRYIEGVHLAILHVLLLLYDILSTYLNYQYFVSNCNCVVLVLEFLNVSDICAATIEVLLVDL